MGLENTGSDGPVGQVDALAVPRFAGVRTFARLPTTDELWRFRDGKVIYFRLFRDPDEALESAGLRE